MATTVWHGHLTFGLVSIPVRLFKAARSEKVRFHQLHKSAPAKQEPRPIARLEAASRAEPSRISVAVSAPAPPVEQYTRVRQSLVLPSEAEANTPAEVNTPKAVPRSELVKGYEYEKDRYVLVEEEDLKKITPQTGTEMEIREFVKLEEIDPVYFETSYYVAPDEAGEKAYALLFQTMRETQFVALAEVVMHRREHVVVLRSGRHGLLAHTMFYTDEIRQDQEHRADTSVVNPKEMQMAKLLVESLAAPFEPAKYKDKFREKLEAVIAAKVEGRQVAQVEAERKPAEVVDILQALEQSLKLARKPATTAPSAAETTPASHKKRQRVR